jgi:hypothetical protein
VTGRTQRDQIVRLIMFGRVVHMMNGEPLCTTAGDTGMSITFQDDSSHFPEPRCIGRAVPVMAVPGASHASGMGSVGAFAGAIRRAFTPRCKRRPTSGALLWPEFLHPPAYAAGIRAVFRSSRGSGLAADQASAVIFDRLVGMRARCCAIQIGTAKTVLLIDLTEDAFKLDPAIGARERDHDATDLIAAGLTHFSRPLLFTTAYRAFFIRPVCGQTLDSVGTSPSVFGQI